MASEELLRHRPSNEVHPPHFDILSIFDWVSNFDPLFLRRYKIGHARTLEHLTHSKEKEIAPIGQVPIPQP